VETATEDELAEVLGDRAEENVVERLAALGVTVDEVAEALEDLEYEARFGEERIPMSPKIEEVRSILEELPYLEELGLETAPEEARDDLDGLSIAEGEPNAHP
jgi:hypothetical protein